ncbi:YXWGXW repeat-containing protein [Dyella sp. C9]|uniref:YXWGXW repeat-containing protein n=1 Tax=Dyella sp. C9 TaxID=2202154 RepID=UPI000DEFFE8C|nr:YXWGXW repeat-containing protein [Dyella sp. C9]
MLSTTRKLALLAAIGIASVGAASYAPTAAAGVTVSVGINVAPPAQPYEAVPPPRVGYVWAPGYWHWEGQRHVWVAGYWMPARPGMIYHAARWEHARDGWRFHEGYWGR